MSRFQPHVSRDRDTSKGKSDFANVLTEGWANIFEPFVPLVCTVTSSGGGGGYVEAPLRGHIFSFFFFFPPSVFFPPFFSLDGKTTENNARSKNDARVMRRYAWTSVEKCAVSPVENKRDEIVIPLDFRRNGDPHRSAIGWIEKFRFRKSITRRQVDRLEKGGKGKRTKQPFQLEILSKSMESRGMKSVWRFDRETRAKRVIWREKKRNETREENRRRAVIKN